MTWLIDREEWLEIYEYIKKSLPSLHFTNDQIATDLLSDIIRELENKLSLQELLIRIQGREIGVVVGCGGRLEEEIYELGKIISSRRLLVVAADGAVEALIEHGIKPDVVVTDLDGDIDSLLYVSRNGSITVVHAHGDNIDRITSYTHLFKGPLIGSTQVEPRPYVYNFGGFTDGDRAAYILYHAGYRYIVLLGFDLDKPSACPGKKLVNHELKKIKLSIAAYLLSRLSERGVRFISIGDLRG